MDTLGGRVRWSRTVQKRTQDDLAKKTGTNKQRMSAIEHDKSLPTVEQLVKMCEALTVAPDQKIVWLLTWLDGKLRQSRLSDEEKEVYQKAIGEAIVKISQSNATWQQGTFRSLEDFPGAFTPLTIICGDRREPYPQSRGDLFAYSAAITDLMFLPWLGLGHETIIQSDKLFVLMDDEYLRREFGKMNLLIIGSPAVNFAARTINNYSVFRFDLAPEVREWAQQLNQVQHNDARLLRIFWRMAENPQIMNSPEDLKEDDVSKEQIEELRDLVKQVIGERTAKELMDGFRKPGLADPVDRRVNGQSTGQHNDFAVISLAKNPFSDTTDYVCILAAGIHGPGTAHAVRVLGRKDEFRDHPFGGVIEVELDQFQDWPTRFKQARWKWQTRRYETQELLKNFKSALKQAPESRNEALIKLTEKEIKNCLEFIQSVSGSDGSRR